MTGPFEKSFHAELMRVAREDARAMRRRRAGRLIGALAAVVAALGAAVAVLLPTPAAADIEITIDDGFIEVRLVGDATSRSELLDALDDAGIDAEVVEIPTGPSQVGLFISTTILGGPRDPVTVTEPSGGAFLGFRLNEDYTGDLVIELGRPARQDELYDAFTDAFAPGEPLHCRGVRNVPLAEAADELRGLAVMVRASSPDGAMHELGSVDDALATEFAALLVVRATANAPDSVAVFLASEPVPGDEQC